MNICQIIDHLNSGRNIKKLSVIWGIMSLFLINLIQTKKAVYI